MRAKNQRTQAIYDCWYLGIGSKDIGNSRGCARAVIRKIGDKVSRLTTIWTDGGFDGLVFMMWAMDICRWIVQVGLRPEQNKGFLLLKKRWVVERTFIYLAMVRIMVGRND